MKRYRQLLLIIPLALGGCGTFELASGIHPPSQKTSEQQQTDILVCKDRARNEANTDGRRAGAYLLGLTIIGTPLAYELERAKQREVFSDCMTALGYRVDPVSSANTTQKSVQQAPPREAESRPVTRIVEPQVTAPAPSIAPAFSAAAVASTPLRDEAAQLEKLNQLRDKGLVTEVEYNAKRKSILDRL